MYISRHCSELIAHIHNIYTQYNLPALSKKLSRKYNHVGLSDRFEDPQVHKSVEADLAMVGSLNQILKKLEWYVEKTARQHDYQTLYLLPSIPGGRTTVILYEIHDVRGFARVQDVSSYARLIRPLIRRQMGWAF